MRSFAFAAVCMAVLLAGVAAAAPVGPGYDIQMGRMIPMRDGVQLEAWITKPSGLKAGAPAILTLTQYDIDGSRRGEPCLLRAARLRVRAGVRARARPLRRGEGRQPRARGRAGRL